MNIQIGKSKYLLIHGLIGIFLVFLVLYFSTSKDFQYDSESHKASEIMQEALDVISLHCINNNINIDEIRDPYNSGLIGPEMSEITTTIGHLDAKRSTINPNLASLLVHLLREAGVKKGDTIAIGSSGSFPALLVASISASASMDLHTRIILSLGSSSYGANNIDFNLIDIYNLLYINNIVDYKPVAVSIGGEKDIGEEFENDVLDKLIEDINEFGVHFINEGDLIKNIQKRSSQYFKNNNSKIAAFINTGGSLSNMGSSTLSLKLEPGLISTSNLPPLETRGMIFTMLAKNIPVVHLLYIKGIVQKYNLDWNPATIPEIVDTIKYKEKKSAFIIILSIIYLLYFGIVLYRFKIKHKPNI